MSYNSEIESIKINKIFNSEYTFIIPIYQRNYAWKKENIDTLLNDILYKDKDITYYLGTIVSYKRIEEDKIRYEVIDGQQRLTTLYLIYLYLEKNVKGLNLINNDKLQFELRDKYIKTFEDIKENGVMIKEENKNDIAEELKEGYKTIKNYFEEQNKNNINGFKDKLEETEIVIITVPEKTDLNNYFKIMNMRGEQLELHHIAKAQFIDKIGSDDSDKKIVALIWDACANMDCHLPRNFSNKIREKIFKKDLLEFIDEIVNLNEENIDEIWDNIKRLIDNDITNLTKRKKIKDILDNKDIENIEEYGKNNGRNNNYNSIMSFPYFLLHVNAVLLNKHEDNMYDDKKLTDNLLIHLNNENSVKKFILYMLKCRFIFDNYIVKKESQDFNESSELKIIKYKFYVDKTSGDYVDSLDNYGDYTLDRLIKLQSTLRITYTSQNNMQWITEVLKYMINKTNGVGNNEIIEGITNLLEKYCIEKIRKIEKINDLGKINFANAEYGEIEWIVFTYLDYLLYRDGYKNIIEKQDKYKVLFRNSVEHFYPQNPDAEHVSSDWYKDIHKFGNLALITKSANSLFSNNDPRGKVFKYKNIIEQSPKLKIMASYISKNSDWTKETAREHQKEMENILNEEINRINSIDIK